MLNVNTCKTIILLVVFYCCDTLTFTLREEQRLSMFDNTELIKIFGAERDETIGEWG